MRITNQTSTIGAVIVFILAVLFIMLPIFLWLEMPIVQQDQSGNCIQVLSVGNNYHCGALPEKYDVQYVAYRGEK